MTRPPDRDAAAERWRRVEEILDRVLESDPAERLALLDEACAGDDELRREVESLLEADAAAPTFLEGGAAEFAAEELAQPQGDLPGLGAGSELGEYRVIESIGSGGMSRVFLAERSKGDFEQRVAIKVLRAVGLDIGHGLERFRLERRVLASLEHPNIARVLDGGATNAGLPYLVMEYIEGQPITDYCAHHRLDLNARLDLALHVCEAVQYAHQRLIVHRDLKPSNILVTDDGQVKLLDFGIAKLLDPEAPELGLSVPLTRTGMLLLTPEYASPEQLLGREITTATDVYGLGVLLYELLTGERPFDLRDKSPGEIERVVCHTEPNRPSSVVRTDPPTGERADVPAKRLRGDLDTIVLKAMRKEPAARYAAAQDLASDVRRFQSGRAVEARPATLGYRAGKFLRRHRVGVGASTLVLLAIVLGVGATTWQARTAQREANRAQAVGDFLFDLFEGADPEVNPGQPLTAIALLDQGARRVDELEAGPQARADLMRILGGLYGKLGEVEKGEAFLRRAVTEAAEGLGAESRPARDARVALAEHLVLVGDPQEAEAILEELLAAGAGEHTAAAHESVGIALTKRGRYDEAEGHLRQAIELRESDPSGPGSDAPRMALGNLLIHQERWQEAEETLRLVLASREAELGTVHPEVADIKWNLSELMMKTARFDEAEVLHREILELRREIYPNGHPDIARSLGQVAAAVQRQGRFEEAGELYEQAVAAWQDRFGQANPSLAELFANLAALRYRLGDLRGAVEMQESGLEILRDIWGEQDDNIVAAGLNNLGVMQRELGNYEAAGRRLTEALEMRRRLHGDGHATVGMSLANLARLRMLEGRLADSERLALQGLTICERQLPAGHPGLLAAQMAAGAALAERGKPTEAVPLLTTVAGAYEKLLPPTDARLGETHLWLGVAKARVGDPDAREHLSRARENLEGVLGTEAALSRRARSELESLR